MRSTLVCPPDPPMASYEEKRKHQVAVVDATIADPSMDCQKQGSTNTRQALQQTSIVCVKLLNSAPTPTPTSRPPVRAHVVFTPVLQHLPLHQAPAEMVAAQAAVATYVAGVQLGVSAARPPRYVTGRKRGKDKPKPPGEPSNRVRTCRICEETDCPGRWGGDKCRELQED